MHIIFEEFKPKRKKQTTVYCKKCHAYHKILYGKKYNKQKRKVIDKELAYYTCGDKAYLAKSHAALKVD